MWRRHVQYIVILFGAWLSSSICIAIMTFRATCCVRNVILFVYFLQAKHVFVVFHVWLFEKTPSPHPAWHRVGEASQFLYILLEWWHSCRHSRVSHCWGEVGTQVGYSWLFFVPYHRTLKSAKTKNPRDLFCFLLKDVRKREAYLAKERAYQKIRNAVTIWQILENYMGLRWTKRIIILYLIITMNQIK